MARQARRGEKRSAPIIRKEERGAEAHHGGAWKVAYADFVTAMMAFFLVMWLLNATTEDQRKGLADYFSPNSLMSHASSGTGQPFGGHTVFDQGALVSDRGAVQVVAGSRPVQPSGQDEAEEPATDPPEAETKPATVTRSGAPDAAAAGSAASAAPADAAKPAARPTPAAQEAKGQDAKGQDANAQDAKAGDGAAKEQLAFQRAADEIRDAVSHDPALAAMAGQIAVDVTPEGLRVQLLDREQQAMFATGSAVPNERARLLIRKIVPVLAKLSEPVSIEGHTDAAPYPGPDRTNWELSAERANAARRMLTEAGLAEARLRDVTGHADHDLLLPDQPLAAANRRIAIMVLRAVPAPGAAGP